MGLAACAALIGARRVPRELLAGCAALAVEGYAALVHSGGGINDVLPAYLAVALLAGLALGSGSAWWVTAASGVLVLAQSVFLLSRLPPVPGDSHQRRPRRRRAADRGHAGARRRRRGPRRPRPEPAGGNGAGRAPGRGVRRAAGHRPGRDRELPAQRGGRRSPPAGSARSSPTAPGSRSRTRPRSAGTTSSARSRCSPGSRPRCSSRSRGTTPAPPSVWLPRGGGSCQAAVSILDGAVKAAAREIARESRRS